MGRRGPRPKPTTLKVLEGNPGRRPLNRREPKPTGVPTCPKHLSRDAKREWQRISRELYRLGLLSRIDRAALAAYCQAWGRWVAAETSLAKHGLIVKSPNGHAIQSPYLSIANAAMKQMGQFLSEFGMSPASRTRIEVGPPAPVRRGEGGKKEVPFDFTGPELVTKLEPKKAQS